MQINIITLRSGFFVTKKFFLLILFSSAVLLVTSSLLSAFYGARTISTDSCRSATNNLNSFNENGQLQIPYSMTFSTNELKFGVGYVSMNISALNSFADNRVISFLVPPLTTILNASVFLKLGELEVEKQFLNGSNQYYVIVLLEGLEQSSELNIIVDCIQPGYFSNGILILGNQENLYTK